MNLWGVCSYLPVGRSVCWSSDCWLVKEDSLRREEQQGGAQGARDAVGRSLECKQKMQESHPGFTIDPMFYLREPLSDTLTPVFQGRQTFSTVRKRVRREVKTWCMQLVIQRGSYEAVSVSLCIRQTVYISLYLHPFDESVVFYVQNAVATYAHSLFSDVQHVRPILRLCFITLQSKRCSRET